MNGRTRLLTYSALMCAIIVVSTLWFKFSIPGTEMLFTTQVFFILLCGQLLPVRYCFFTIGVYLLLGLIGLPVFSATVGPAVLVTPSFGYLLGFPFGAAAVSLLNKKLSGRAWGRYAASLCGVAVIYLIALPYIACLKTFYLAAPLSPAVLVGAYCLAFLPMDILKAALAALVGKRLEKPLRLLELSAER